MTDEANRNLSPDPAKQPGAPRSSASAVPRGLEVLLKKAAVDPEFRRLLLELRGAAAVAIGLELEPAEVAMLNSVPADQLSQLIDHTTVPPEQRRVFLGRTAASMLLAAGATALLLPMCGRAKSRGIQPDGTRGIQLDRPESGGATFGNRPD